jgi:hypothetical protein
MVHRRLYGWVVVCLCLLVSCSPGMGLIVPSPASTVPGAANATMTPFQPLLATYTATPFPEVLWIGDSVPPGLRDSARAWDIPLVDRANAATLYLDQGESTEPKAQSATWVYALVAPFSTVTGGVASEQLRQAWGGSSPAPFSGHPLLMDEATLAAFTLLWGEPASGAVRTVAADQLLETAWSEQPSWGIVPFEALEPRWKVLTVDGQSPLHNDFDPVNYPLVATFSLACADLCGVSPLPELPATNRDPFKLTTLIMTGVTALVRATAYTMEVKGVTYPGRDIRDWLRSADISHINNEVPFYGGCPYPNPNTGSLIFCSDPRYIELLMDVGTDVIELAGDHLNNYGDIAIKETLALYRENGLRYYGGGANLEEAQRPLLIENHGNKLAFMGCNAKGDKYYGKATETRPGPAPCNYKYIANQIDQLRKQGYLVIFTFQHQECYSADPCYTAQPAFRRVADAGAVIVSGSQAHYAQVMEFRNGSFIHYGLGNLFFDQMYHVLDDGSTTENTRREFLDRHVFYDGRYIGTELLTAMLEDYSRPRPMTPDERAAFLTEYFADSGWIPFVPTPTPTVTATLTPLSLPRPIQTLTLSPAP